MATMNPIIDSIVLKLVCTRVCTHNFVFFGQLDHELQRFEYLTCRSKFWTKCMRNFQSFITRDLKLSKQREILCMDYFEHEKFNSGVHFR